MKKLLICTKNQGKFIEISNVLKELPAKLVSLEQAGLDFEVEETGKTYAENAILKARTYGQKANLVALGDDAGIEVSALNGAPGVYSNRFFKTTGEERNRELLDLIKENPDKKARFVAFIAIFNPKNSSTKTFSAVQNGLLVEPRGNSRIGLGYDSIFYTPEFGKTNAELSLEEKSQISHRGLAVQKAKKYLREIL